MGLGIFAYQNFSRTYPTQMAWENKKLVFLGRKYLCWILWIEYEKKLKELLDEN
jgi:hypothetical protein